MTFIQTVTGLLDPSQSGAVQLHEHVIFDLTCRFTPPPQGEERQADTKLSLQTLGWIRMNPYNNRENLQCLDAAIATEELASYRTAGGGLIVDVSSKGIGRNPRALRQASLASGVPVVMGCGYYIEVSHSPQLRAASVADLTKEMVDDLTEGVEGTGIRAGVIGEIGTSNPLGPGERKCLRAACEAQQQTGASMVVHSPGGKDGPMLVADFLESEGADPSKVVISHLDARFREDLDAYARLADRGFLLGLDTFGRDIYIAFLKTQLPSDSSRIRTLVGLCEMGLTDQLVVSQDICLKMELTQYGGYGYGHILKHVRPRLLEAGIGNATLTQLLVTNPARLLAFSIG